MRCATPIFCVIAFVSDVSSCLKKMQLVARRILYCECALLFDKGKVVAGNVVTWIFLQK